MTEELAAAIAHAIVENYDVGVDHGATYGCGGFNPLCGGEKDEQIEVLASLILSVAAQQGAAHRLPSAPLVPRSTSGSG